MKKILSLFLAVMFFGLSQLRADEGMWIPLLLGKYNIEDMQKLGCKLSAEDIYSVNNSSLKDAIVIFGRGCTGELISNEGLLITNHHCGYGEIQAHSSLEHDYLTNGFWAMNRSEELPNPGLSVTFLVRMEDVTAKVLNGITNDLPEYQRTQKINAAIALIVAEATKDTHYEAVVKPFFGGNEYYLFVNEVYKDVRLVGAPPSAIGKFGGDTDNWMWPRHTGDFSLFRIYAAPDGTPAEFSDENVPLTPKRFLTISTAGVKPDDFTMVFGYPGTTQQYLTSFAVEQIQEMVNPHRIALRQKKLDILNVAMNSNPAIRIQYSAKHASISNSWKKWIGENRGLERLNAVEVKKLLESEFQTWANQTPERKAEYGSLLSSFEVNYTEMRPYLMAETYLMEAGLRLDPIYFCHSFRNLMEASKAEATEDVKTQVANLKSSAENFYKDYDMQTDKKLFVALLQMFYEKMPKEFQPAIFTDVVEKKFKGDFNKYADYVYENSIVVNKQKMLSFLNSYDAGKLKNLQNDPMFALYEQIINMYWENVDPKITELEGFVARLERLYIKGLREMKNDEVFYPDANFTLRVAYGKVQEYKPQDGVRYLYYTTLDGIIAKDNPEIYDYKVPEKLKKLYETKDYGNYAENGEMHVCFIATNHTTGGNSGSPVLDAEGRLIGVNFDRCWEGTMSDIMYDPNQCRNISLDIRYALFIIDKFAGATHLINEMKIE